MVCGARRQGCAGNRRHGAAGVSALGGEGDPGAAAGRDAARPTPMASATGNWRWPAPPIPARPMHAELAASMLAQRRARRYGAGMRQRTGRSTTMRLWRSRARAGSRTRCTTIARASIRGFLCTCVPCGHRPPGLCRRRPSVPGDGARDHAGGDGRRARRRQRGIDGCSIPTYAVPLKSLALGFARMATGRGLRRHAPGRPGACSTPAWPSRFYVAGTGSADTRADAGRAGPDLHQDRRGRRLLRGRSRNSASALR